MITCFGELLLRLSPPDKLRFAQANSFDVQIGGSEANVAVSLSQFGLCTQYISRLPDNDLANAALNELNKWRVSTIHCAKGGERLGLYFLETGGGSRASQVIYDRAHSGMATLEKGMIKWSKVLTGTKWLHWSGITPALSKSAAEATLEAISAAKSMGIKVSCDLNYRANLWQYGQTPAEVMPELLKYCDLVLGDANAFELYFSIKAVSEEDYLRQLLAQFPNLQQAAMSARQGLSASHNTYQGFLCDGNEFVASPIHDIPDILDRIGSGDAFMSGLLFGLIKGKDLQATVNFAAAAATLKHYINGDFNLSTVEEVESLMAGNTGGKVKR